MIEFFKLFFWRLYLNRFKVADQQAVKGWGVLRFDGLTPGHYNTSYHDNITKRR